MEKLKYLGCCLLAGALVGCGQSKQKTPEAEESTGTESVEQAKETSLTDSPLELADFAVECFRTNEREKLLPYATERCSKNLRHDMAIEEQMKNDRGIRELREQLQSTTYTRSQVEDMGSSNKQVRYTSNPAKYNIKVLLELQDGKWLIDQVGPDFKLND